jgi:hypothetical protein
MEDFNSKYTGEQVEQLLDKVANGEAGGGNITVETDPIFSASAAASITEEKKAEWDGKYTKPNGGIPASDLASDVFLRGEKGEKGDKGDQGEQGVQGEQGEQGPKGDDGVDGEDGATFTPSVDADGNLSWTNNKGLSNPPTVNIKGPKGDSGEGGGSSDSARKEVIYVDDPSANIANMKPNVVYWIDGVNEVTIESFEAPSGGDTYDVFTAIIMSGGLETISLSLPDNVHFANGEIPTINEGDICLELSISRISDDSGSYCHNAVLTKF